MSAVDHREAIMLLNELLTVDPKAIAALVGYRVPCNALMQGHKALPCERDYETGRATIGLLGILNALFDFTPDGRGRITAVVSESGVILAFAETEE